MEINNDVESAGINERTLKQNLLAMLIFFASFLVVALATFIKLLMANMDRANALTFSSMLLALAFLMSSLTLYYFFSRSSIISNTKYLFSQMTAFCLVYIICMFSSVISVFLMPIFLTAYWIAPISKRRDAFLLNLLLNVMVLLTLAVEQHITGGNSYLTPLIMCIIGIIVGTLISYSVSYDIKRFSFIMKGIIVSVISILIMISLSFIENDKFLSILPDLTYMAIAALIQLFLGLIGQPVFETLFNLVTNSRLIELTDHNMPLIKRLMDEAPGTFNHSLAVANYAEMCASALGENPYLARACAYYHDIGKIENPEYFSENQSEHNPHDELLPEVSAEIIKNHTYIGYELCKEYRIPHEVSAVTLQHHGTLPIIFFYNKAKQMTDSKVEIKDYSYNGTVPVSKVNAIIMICDSSEATIRAMDKPNSEKVDAMLRSFIKDRIEGGQFNNCDITLKDLDIIRETIKSAFGGQYHKRVKYADDDKDE